MALGASCISRQIHPHLGCPEAWAATQVRILKNKRKVWYYKSGPRFILQLLSHIHYLTTELPLYTYISKLFSLHNLSLPTWSPHPTSHNLFKVFVKMFKTTDFDLFCVLMKLGGLFESNLKWVKVVTANCCHFDSLFLGFVCVEELI